MYILEFYFLEDPPENHLHVKYQLILILILIIIGSLNLGSQPF